MKKREQKTYYIVSLGCAKNTVDATSMGTLLEEDGFRQVNQPNKANVLLVNTCGFIQSARDESIKELRELAEKKKPGQLLVATGCMTQRYRQKVAEMVPGIDGLLGTRRWMDIVSLLDSLRGEHPGVRYDIPDDPTVGKDEQGVVRVAIQGPSAYLKIADGCRRPCAFCAIPLIKGTLVSRPEADILADARSLDDMNLKELILIAQDTTDYAHDLGVKDGLTGLLRNILDQTAIPWIRVMYAYPGTVTDSFIELMASNPRILPYLDMPLQHGSPKVLKSMLRPSNLDWVYKTVDKMRSRIPNLALRSTFIVGYPGETEDDFDQLLQFIRDLKFDRAGAFTFSYEEGTASQPLGDPIPEEVKNERYLRFMQEQERISLGINQGYIGKKLEVLIEGIDGDIAVGRSYRDAPEIDGYVIVNGKAAIGEIVTVQIDGAMSYDLTGKLIR